MTNSAGLRTVASEIVNALGDVSAALKVPGPMVCSLEDGRTPHQAYDVFVSAWTAALKGILDDCQTIVSNTQACAAALEQNDQAAAQAEAAH